MQETNNESTTQEGSERLYMEARAALAKLIQLYPLLPPEKREELLADIEGLIQRLQAQPRQPVAPATTPQKKGGILARIRSAIERAKERAILTSLPSLVMGTPEIPSELIARYLDLFQNGYNPVEEAAIRRLFVEVKTTNPSAYNKILKLLSAGPPWSMWAIAVIDRVANARTNIPVNLAKVWSEFTAYSHRDIYYIMEKLRQMGRPDLADKIWRLVVASETGDKNAKKTLDEIKKIVYEIPPPPRSFTLLSSEKITYIEQLLSPQSTRVYA